MAYSADIGGASDWRLAISPPKGRCDRQRANTSLLGGGGVDGATIGPPGLSFWPNAENWGDVRRERHGSPARTGCRPRMSSIPLARSGKVGPPGNNKFWRTAIAHASASPARRDFRDVAFPAIATGIYGFPHELAARIAVTTVGSHLAERQLHRVGDLCLF